MNTVNTVKVSKVEWCNGSGLFSECDFAEGNVIFEEQSVFSMSITSIIPMHDAASYPCDVIVDEYTIDCTDMYYYIVKNFTTLRQKLLVNNYCNVENVESLDKVMQDYRKLHATTNLKRRLYDMILANCMWSNLPNDRINCVGIWKMASKLNHACIPNCAIVINGNRLRLVSLRHIAQGEELTIHYTKIPLLSTTETLLRRFGFVCNCKICRHCEDVEVSLCVGQAYSIRDEINEMQKLWNTSLNNGLQQNESVILNSSLALVINKIKMLPNYFQGLFYMLILKLIDLHVSLNQNTNSQMSDIYVLLTQELCNTKSSCNLNCSLLQLRSCMLEKINFNIDNCPLLQFYSVTAIAGLMHNTPVMLFDGDQVCRFILTNKFK